jgi:DNA-binding transcriptional LysR family regulator
MRIDYLRYFDHLADVLNYTRAAEDLFIAQPTLSVAIKRMEKELGFGLIRRIEGTSKIELTEAGAAFREHVQASLKSYDQGIRVAQEIEGQLNSELRVGTIYAMQGNYWSEALQAFVETQTVKPQMSFRQAYSYMLAEAVRKGELDAAFASRVEGYEDLNHCLVWSQSLVVAVNKSNPLAKRKQVSLSDLAGIEVLTYGPTSPTIQNMRKLSLPEGVRLRAEYADEITMCSLISSNPSSAALFCYSFLTAAFQDVVCLPISGVPADFQKVYLISRNETHTKVVEEFLGFMGSYRFPRLVP